MRSCPQCAYSCDESHKFCPACGFPISEVLSGAPAQDPFIGRNLPGGYVILDLVGIGGMGRVYRAEQRTLGRTVAVKVIHPHLLGDESASARFITEARAASRLNHPNSVGVIDFGRTDDGQLYLVMEFLRGRDLSRVAYEDGPLPNRRIINILKQALAALSEAHHLGIVHRDLKPENIVLEPLRAGGDFIKVVDFGLAKMRQGVQGGAVTTPGIICGTPDYMAPEQGRGQAIDARTDLYAMGVILFQLLTGRLPFEAESPTQVVLMHLSIPPPDPRQVAPDRAIPDSLAEIVARALSKSADDRFASADEFSEALDASLQRIESLRTIASTQVTCLSCQAQVPISQRFCGDCGARITVPPGVSRPPASSVNPSFSRHPLASFGAPSTPLPLTSRDEDLQWLASRRDELRSTLTGARVMGENGVGKTRLVREFLHDARAAGDLVVETGPDPWWAEVGYYAVRKAIVALAQLDSSGGTERDWLGANAEARRGLSDILGKSDANSHAISPEERRYTAAEALRWALGRASTLASNRMVVVFVDDLHLVDGSSRNAFADALLEPSLVPVLILAAHTPSFEPGWGSAEQTRTLWGLPSAVAQRIAKGLPPKGSSTSDPDAPPSSTVLPLYIEQLVRFSSEGGSQPPRRLADLITLRIERLAPPVRRVLQALAVLGDDVEPPDLEAMVPQGSAVKPGAIVGVQTLVSEGIAALIAAKIIERGPNGLRHTHPLIREITNAAIPAGVRRELHTRAARIAETRKKPIEVRALHLLYAQDAFEALLLLEQVADRAIARGDARGAVTALHRGLELARRELVRGELEDPMNAVLIFSRKLGEALALAGDLTDAEGVLREALDVAGPSGKDRAKVLRALATVAHGRSRQQDALRFWDEAWEHATRSGAHDLLQALEETKRMWAS